MPLVRYEVRCEHRLANPELYRSAARDDPESLLEGVAMAGLVGIVRQLGDLAEFAAEIFCSLHDELMTIGARGHALHLRVQQLEDELPGVEKALLSEPNQLRFAYTNGADWHASIRSDQNHCTSDDLPRFVRNYYEECRGPPQLFLLDKFDVSGVGACLKRYTDPSFFKLEWASTELMKAQREQRDKKARRDKKKGRKRRTGEPTAAINQIPARVRYGSASLEDLEGLPHDIASALKFELPGSSRLGSNCESDTQSPGASSIDCQDILVEGPNSPAAKSIHVSAVSNTPFGVKHFKISVKDTRSANDSGDESVADEPEDKANTSSDRIARLIDHEDRVAAPAKGHIGALGLEGLECADGFQDASGNGHQSLSHKSRKGTSRDESGIGGMPRSMRTPVGTPRGVTNSEFPMDGRKAENPSPGKPPYGSDSPMLLRSLSRKSVYMDALDSGRLSGKFLWRNNMDGDEYSRQVSIARSGSEFDEFVDAPSRIVSEGESDFDSPGSIYKGTHFNGDPLNHAALKNHVEAQKGEIMSGLKLMEQLQNGRLSHDQVLEDDARYPDQVLEDAAVHPDQVLENAAVHSEQVLENLAAQSDQVMANLPAHPHQDLENDNVHVLKDAAVHSDLQLSSTAKPDIVSELEGSARHDESVPPPGTSSNADAIPSSPRCGTPQLPVFSESSKSSLLSPRAVGSTGSSAPSSPVGSPKRSFQRIFQSSLSALSSPSPLRTISDDASLRHSLGNEESNPSSPSSSVIIKDSPPESARSSYSGSECESRDFDAILGRPATSGPASFPGHGVQESASKQIADVDELASIASLRVTSPKTVAQANLADFDEVASIASLRVTSPKTVTQASFADFDEVASIASLRVTSPKTGAQASLADFDEVASIASLRVTSPKSDAQTISDEVENLLLSPTSNSSKHTEMAAEISAKFSLDSSVSKSSADHSVSQERMAPSLQPQVDPTPTTLKPITTVRTTSKSYKSLTSNSPPDSPFGSDLGSNVNTQWRGKVVPPSTPPRTAFKLPHHPPFRSPVHTPRSFFSETGTLKWLGRMDPGLSPKPNFSLPPDLVCHSVSSSPVCSPPPQLDLDSPSKSEVVSEDLGSPHSTTIILHSSEDESEEENHLTSPPASTSSNVGVFPSLRLDTEESVSGDERREPQLLEHGATSKLSASSSSASSLKEVSPPVAVDVEEYFVLTRVAEIEQLAVSSGEALPIRSLRKSSSALDAAGASEAHRGTGVGVVDDASMQESVSRDSEGRPAVEIPSSADAKVHSLDNQPSLLAEGPDSTSDNDHARNDSFGPSSPHDQVDSALTLPDHISDTIHEQADLASAAGNALPSLSENEDKKVVFEPDVSAAHRHEEALPPVPLEANSRPLDGSEPVSGILEKADPTKEVDVDAAHSDEEVSPSIALKAVASRTLEKVEPVREVLDKPESASETDGWAAHSDEEASPSVPLKEAGSRILSEFEPAKAVPDLIGGAGIQMEPPLESTSVKLAVSGPRFTDVTEKCLDVVQKDEPSLSPPMVDNREESAPLQTTKAKSTKAQSVEDASAPSESEFRTTPNTKAALEAAITRHDRNMLKELTFQEPVRRPRPSTDERSFFVDQIRNTSFNLRRTESGDKKDLVPRPVANINVAAILEKANAIRQAFAGSDDDDGDDDWSDS